MFRSLAATAACALTLAGCQTVDRPDFTLAELRAASPPIRHDVDSLEDRDRFLAEVRAAGAAPTDGTFDLLALSSGGANGAYGAGVLVGWSRHGARPEFEVVTGVSIGALIAPFAFIGPDGDAALRAAFTDGRSDNLMQPRWAMALFGPGLFRTRPLRELVAKAVDDDLLRRVAEGHRRGRRLYVATTSLDTRGQVIWDMGALAASDRPDSRDRFIDILTAAASVPGAFAPVFIDLENGGRRVRELHVDGRATANFFIAPVLGCSSYGGMAGGGRSLEARLNASTRTSLIAAAQFARLNSLTFQVTTAGEAGKDQSLAFDQAHMIQLFELGERRAVQGRLWAEDPLY